MTEDPRWTAAESILEQALERAPAERSAFLDGALEAAGLGDDPDLRATLDAILAEEERTGFLEPGAMRRRPTFRHLESALEYGQPHPERVGPYRLLEEIGRGGMARVFLGERVEGGFDQRVAIKLIRPRGVDHEAARQRFEQERRILAGLGHPAIARLLDGGEADGQPWFAMELVEGEPIERFCRDHALALEDRLRLFLGVAEAVAHAHRNLVVHRDLKSSNVMVTGDGEVKLLDFGIAKLVEPAAHGLTETDQRPMTPEYASPEQVLGRPVTTASDVYQLGHLLYRLITDRSPYRGDTTTPPSIHRAILTETPVLPSEAAVAEPEDGRPEPTANLERPVPWAGQLRGDLDAVVMMALRKEPERRYATVEQLLDDLRAFLDGRPVRARPDSLGYRFGKLVRRHRAAFSVAVIALSLLVTAIALFTARLARERDRALREATKAQTIASFLVDTFRASDPNVARGESVSARDLLDRGTERIRQGLEEEPVVKAALLDTMGLAYRELGLNPPAEELLRDALDERTRLLGARHPDTLKSAERLGSVLWREGRFEEAAQLHQSAYQRAREDLGNQHPQTLSHAVHLGLDLWRLGRYDEAQELLQSTIVTMDRVLGPDHLDTISARSNLAGVMMVQGRFAEAAALYRDVLAADRRLRGSDHHETLTALYNLGLAYRELGRYDEAEPLLAEAVERRRRVFGDEHPATLGSISALAGVYAWTGRFDEAIRLHRETLETRRRVLGDQHRETLGSLQNVAATLYLAGRMEEALEGFRENLDARRAALGPEHPATLRAAKVLAQILTEAGRFDEAETLSAATLETYRSTQSPDHRIAIELARDLGSLRCRRGAMEGGEALIRDALERARSVFVEDALLVGATLAELGRCLTGAGRYREAESALLEGFGLIDEADLQDPAPLARAREGLALLYRAWDRPAEAERWEETPDALQ